MRPRRSPLLRLAAPLITLACVLAGAPALGAQEGDVPESQAPSAQQVSAENSEGAPDSLRGRVNAFFGTINSAMASVIFYDLGHKRAVVELEGVPAPGELPELATQLEAAIEGAGMTLWRSDIALTLPAGSTPEQAQELEHALAAQLSDFEGDELVQRYNKLEVAVDEDAEQPGLQADQTGVPMAVLVLVLGAIFFTLRMGFPQFKAFRHAIDVVRGKYDDPNDQGEVTSFQALTAALSATVGLGNIAGVAIAVSVGGPGATFWMIVAGFLGMASKFTECTLGQMYREVRPDGRVMGGAMFYLSKGLAEMRMGGLGKVLAVIFAIVCIGASFGGGNSFQVNQSLGAVKETFPFLNGREWMYGVAMAVLVGVVIIGGIKRIAHTAEKIVPTMCVIYVLACLAILLMNLTAIPAAIGAIFAGAFTPMAGFGGFLGVLVQGFKRAAFSNEAGIGSAAIAHSAARVPHPSREGIVALLEPFIDTIVVCTMTALVIVITGAYNNPDWQHLVDGNNGAALTSNAMGTQMSWFPYILSVAVILFAFSTLISWSYYGERCWAYLFGDGSSLIYRLIFIVFCFLGAVAKSKNVLDFGDLLIFGMVLPNIIGVVLLSGKVRRAFDEYMTKLRAGEYKTFK